jgi:hypothetical protein
MTYRKTHFLIPLRKLSFQFSKEMTHFNDYSYYLKSIRWILNNSLAEITIRSPSLITRLSADAEKEKHVIKEEMKSAAPIPDLEKWSEYKVRRLVEETSMN